MQTFTPKKGNGQMSLMMMLKKQPQVFFSNFILIYFKLATLSINKDMADNLIKS